MENKLYALQRASRKYKWYVVIDCGETQKGGFASIGSFDYFTKDGRTYRWHSEIFMPPDYLTGMQEIKTIEKNVTCIDDNQIYNRFEGFDDGINSGYITIQNILSHIEINKTLEEIKELYKV